MWIIIIQREKTIMIQEVKKNSFRQKKFMKYETIGEGNSGQICFCVKLSGAERYTVKIFNKISEKQKKENNKEFG